MDGILLIFIEESRELLESLEGLLLDLERGQHSEETLDAIFRAAHTLKGASGVAEVGAIEAFTHVLENLLDEVREGKIGVTPELVSLLLQSCDFILSLIRMIEDTTQPPVVSGDLAVHQAQLLEQLRHYTREPDSKADSRAEQFSLEEEMTDLVGWHISLRLDPQMMKQGMDPSSCLTMLAEMGEIQHFVTLTDRIPGIQSFDPEALYLGFEFNLQSHRTLEELSSAFIFIEDGSIISILRCDAPADEYLALIDQLPESTSRMLELLEGFDIQCFDVLKQTLTAPIATAQSGADDPIGEITTSRSLDMSMKTENTPAEKEQKSAQGSRMIRVPADKLDHLIDLIGELVIAGSSVQLLSRNIGDEALTESNEIMARLVEDVRDSALQMRMVTIGETFNRFQRVVRDTASELGKEITLEVFGAETELDKSVVERLSDPLLHLVRNAMDHGVETSAERLRSNKTNPAKVTLNAYHDSGNVVIEISDDGRGLNKQKIVSKAIANELIPAEHTLNDQEIYQLIFEPGFSTADSVTNLSGRGVGMDVVKRTINSLRGTIDVHSEAGSGSKFILRLPLTLAIIDGFLVSGGDQNYVIPLDNVVECLEFEADDLSGDVLQLRGKPLPIIRIRELFTVNGDKSRRQNVVVVHAGGVRAGLVVDHLHGEIQTVIKPLGQLFKHLRGVAGSTILGSGDVALILDVSNLVSVAATNQHHDIESKTRNRARSRNRLVSE